VTFPSLTDKLRSSSLNSHPSTLNFSMQTAITPTRADNFPEWYQQVIKAADLAENSECAAA
jgi:prolyl-tRNA synthetase (EC 6.1.1.15)